MEDLEIIIGTYENLILGYKVIRNISGNGSYSLETSFTDDSHRGALRCMSVSSSGVLASSSTDDSIRLHNLRKRKDVGGLFEHSGTVNCLTFFGHNHMFSASEDGTICMWKSKGWEMLRTLKGHKSHVMAIAVHSSGKLGLSVGVDKSFLTWDLVTGKLAFQRKLKEVAQNIFFTSSGGHYVLIYQKKIEVCSLENTKIVQEININWRINTVCFIQGDIMAVGGDDSKVLVVDVMSGKTLLTLDCTGPKEEKFTSRVKCICAVSCMESTILTIGMANGNIKVFKLLLQEGEEEFENIFFYETKVRLTCLAVFNHREKGRNDEVEVSENKKSHLVVQEDVNLTKNNSKDKSKVLSNKKAKKLQSNVSPKPVNKKRKIEQDSEDEEEESSSEEHKPQPPKQKQNPKKAKSTPEDKMQNRGRNRQRKRKVEQCSEDEVEESPSEEQSQTPKQKNGKKKVQPTSEEKIQDRGRSKQRKTTQNSSGQKKKLKNK
ncbi:p21-activated protein kinase-interacting protein 1-like isoform X1 [Physella acuta]|uniref:p21-activated protein kinase-interacting protein 1-like isoform X1 n=1 Tax=Physella acuta TaxID=109671 RepID=UPI0027DB97A5|nr:p21-activated protein kinase-interacting protein 1-like isoform X1 [Physella acuta]